MSTTFSNLLYHVVFSTKNRAPQIRGPGAGEEPEVELGHAGAQAEE